MIQKAMDTLYKSQLKKEIHMLQLKSLHAATEDPICCNNNNKKYPTCFN